MKKNNFLLICSTFLVFATFLYSSCRKESGGTDDPIKVDLALLTPINGRIISVLRDLEITWEVTEAEDITATIFYGTSKDNLSRTLLVGDANAGKKNLEDIQPFETYYFKVQIEKDGEILATSATWSFKTTLGYTVALTSPEENKEFFPDENISFSWKNSLEKNTKYSSKFSYSLLLSEDGKTYTQEKSDISESSVGLKNSFSRVGEYFWKVRASYDNGKDSLVTGVQTFKTRNLPPSAPEIKKPKENIAVKAGEIVFEWKASTDGNDGDLISYDLFVQENEKDEQKIASDLVNTSYNHNKPLKDGANFSWWIVARDSQAEEVESTKATFKTVLNTPPKKAVISTLIDGNTNVSFSEKLTWEEASDEDGDNITYGIYVNGVLSKTTTGTEYSLDSLGLQGKKTYSLKIVTMDGNGGETSSEEISFTLENRPPNPVALTTPENDATEVAITPNVTWAGGDDPDEHIVSFSLLVSENSDFSEPIISEQKISETSYSIPSGKLVGAKKYYWQVTAIDEHGKEATPVAFAFTTKNRPPSSPTLTAPANKEPNASLSPLLQWVKSTDQDGNTITYDVTISKESDLSKPFYVKKDVQDTSFIVSSEEILLDETCYWRVTAYDGKGGKAESKEIFSFTPTKNPPKKPTLSTPTNGKNKEVSNISFSWEKSTDDAGGERNDITYKITISEDENLGPPSLNDKGFSEETYTLDERLIKGGRTYYWGVSAVDQNGGEVLSEIRYFTTKNRPPTKPILASPLDKKTGVDSSPTLTWQKSTDPDEHNVVYYFYLSGDESFNNILETKEKFSESEYTPASTLTFLEKYYWKVIAEDELQARDTSDVFSFTVKNNSPPTEPSIIFPQNEEEQVDLKPTFNWNESQDDDGHIISYKIIVSTNSDLGGAIIEETPLSATNYLSPIKLAPGTKYYWQVIATDEFGVYERSEKVSFTTAKYKITSLATANDIKSIAENFVGRDDIISDESIDSSRIFRGTYSTGTKITFAGTTTPSGGTIVIDSIAYKDTKAEDTDVSKSDLEVTFKKIGKYEIFFNTSGSSRESRFPYKLYITSNAPDREFRNALSEINSSFITDDFLNISQAQLRIARIDVFFKKIRSLLGIEYFTSLTELYCNNNDLTSLDVSNLTSLTELNCYGNNLTSLDVSNLASLTYLDCEGNDLTNLDLSNLTGLTELYCYENDLTSLDVSNLTSLTRLDCQDNDLTSLDVSNLTDLTSLFCYENDLTSLDVSNLTSLIVLGCQDNALTNLDVSNLTSLRDLNCSHNNLTNLEVSNLTSLIRLYCYENALTSLDVSNLTRLTELYCYENDLTSLDVSNLTRLTWLDCSANMLTILDISSQSTWNSLNIYAGINSPNPQLSEIKVHEIQECHSGIKDIFNQNKDTLEMKIISFDDDGTQVEEYDEAGYEEECSP